MVDLTKAYEMSVCEIKTMDNDLLVAGFITKITDEYVQIASYKGERLPLLKFDMHVKISIHNAKNGFRVVAGEIYISTDEMMRIVNVASLNDFERRAFFRVQVGMPAKLIQVTDEYEASEPNADEPEETSIIVENLSLSGLLFYPEEQERTFFMGDRFIVELGMPAGKINFNIRIRRYEQYEGRPKKYGCEFYGYTQKQSDRLCNYIFEIERELIRRKKKMD